MVRRASRLAAAAWRWVHARVRWRDVVIVALIGCSILFSVHEVQASNRQWCDTLTLLTSKPVPRPADPQANPSRMQTYTLYEDFAVLRHRLGC